LVKGDAVEPTLDEIRKFNPGALADVQEGEDATQQDIAAVQRAPTVFERGDIVRVTQGDFTSLNGRVDSVSGESVTIVLLGIAELADERYVFMPSELCKFFDLGTNVKVVNGQHKGKVGMVLRAEGEVVTLLTHVTHKEIRVLAADLQATSQTTSGAEVVGNIRLHDLVQLEGGAMTDIGVVVKCERDHIDVLDNSGTVRRVGLSAVKLRRNTATSVTLDAQQNQVSVGDLLKVLDGPNKGRSGTIKHVWKSFIWLHTPTRTENSGILVVRARQCVLTGAASLSRRNAKSGGAMGAGTIVGGGRGRGRGRGAGVNPLINKTARIKAGPFKGYRCIVKEASEMMARVELCATAQKVSVPVANLEVAQDATLWDGETMQTPYHGDAQTPMFTPRTPFVDGSATPMRDIDGSRTPQRDDDWVPRTPMRGDGEWHPSNEMGSMGDTMGMGTAAPSPGYYMPSVGPHTPGVPQTPNIQTPGGPATPGGAMGQSPMM